MVNMMFDEIELGEFDINSFMEEIELSDTTLPSAASPQNRQILFAIDVSNSMQGYKIGAVNDCVNNIVSKIKSYDRGNNNISVSVLGFSSRLIRWTNGFVPVSEFKYSYVETVDGISDVGNLFQELYLLTDKHMNADSACFVILFSDGLYTDEYDEKKDLWEKTDLYKNIKKIVVSFEDDLPDPQSMAFFKSFADAELILPIREQERLLAVLMN